MTRTKAVRHTSKAQEGVRFCPTIALTERVPTWDGVPIDVDVTLPATGKGPWPTIAMLQGDTAKLELLGRDEPYFRASNSPFGVALSNLLVALPTP